MSSTEARTHGVGYYAFSTDEAERAKQQNELETTRAKTLDAQQKRDAQRAAREKIIAERVRAAQNRQRARAGLPPLEDKPELEVPAVPDVSAEDIKKQAKEAKAIKQKEREAAQRAAARKQHVRPWDKGKDSRKREHGSDDDEDSEEEEEEWQYKAEKEPMSQEKWNELQRSQRKSEFAPVPETALSTSHNRHQPFVSARIINEVSDHEDEEVDYNIAPPGTSHINSNDHEEDFLPNNEFQSRSSSNATKHKSFASSSTTTTASQRNKKQFVRRHIENLVSDEETGEPEAEVRRPEFAPPATFEYYGPTSGGHKRPAGVKSKQLESSIEAGLKFLREQSDKDTVSTKMKWASNAGY